MNEQKIALKKGMHPAILALLMLALAPLSAVFLAEAHSFIHLFDALTVEARAAFPLISVLSLLVFLFLQAVLTGLCAEVFYQKRGRAFPMIAALLGACCGLLISPFFYGSVVFVPFLLVLSFVPAGALMARSYAGGEEKKTSVLWACGGAAGLFALTLLLDALFYEKGFAVYFGDFFSRIAGGVERYANESVTVQVALSGGEQAFFEKMTAGQKVESGLTAEQFITALRQTYSGACTFLIYLLPGILFDLFTIPCYLGYGTFRLARMLAGDREKRPLTASPVAAVTLSVCLIFYAFISMFLGGGMLTVLSLNLIVMLTPLLFVPGVKVTVDMMKQLFKTNKLMFIVSAVIILFSPFMVVALSGCYAIFGQMLRRFLEKRGIGS